MTTAMPSDHKGSSIAGWLTKEEQNLAKFLLWYLSVDENDAYLTQHVLKSIIEWRKEKENG